MSMGSHIRMTLVVEVAIHFIRENSTITMGRVIKFRHHQTSMGIQTSKIIIINNLGL